MAIVEKRARFSRDLHDVLGHSLTVVAVKSELARKLVPIDQGRAITELADIERLTRSALADLRSAVAGYREMDFEAELAGAHVAFAAAQIDAHLPSSGDAAASDSRELFGWVLRESVTNVIRHSHARACWVRITENELMVEDDGRGMVGNASERIRSDRGSDGAGLRGIAERCEAVGAELLQDTSPHGGVRLRVRRSR